MCEGGAGILAGEVTIDVQPGRTYDLVASASPGAKSCEVSATMRGAPGT
jgi:hypothetical protein